MLGHLSEVRALHLRRSMQSFKARSAMVRKGVQLLLLVTRNMNVGRGFNSSS